MDPSTIPSDDVLALVQQIINAAKGNNWLVAVPLIVIAAIAAFRKWIVPLSAKLAFFKTDRGGAVLSLIGAVATAVISAAALPGPHSPVAIIVAVIGFLVANQSLFVWLKKIIAPTGADAVQAADAKAVAVAAASATSPTAAAASINEAAAKMANDLK